MGHEHIVDGTPHTVVDSGPVFRVDPDTRNILITSEHKRVTLMQFDHNSERFTFEIPKEVDGHDMSKCNRAQVHYINISGEDPDVRNIGIYPIDDLTVDPEDKDSVICSWLVSKKATQLVGTLNFVLRLSCVSEDDLIPDYSWNTAICSGISIASGINNTEDTVKDHADVLEKWYRDVVEAESKALIAASAANEAADYATAASDYANEEAVNAKTAAATANEAANRANLAADNANAEMDLIQESFDMKKAEWDKTVDEFANYQAVKTVDGRILRFFIGTQAAYDALPEDDKTNLHAIITDDKTFEEIEAEIVALREKDSEHELVISAHTQALIDLQQTDQLHTEAISDLQQKTTSNDQAISSLQANANHATWQGENNEYTAVAGLNVAAETGSASGGTIRFSLNRFSRSDGSLISRTYFNLYGRLSSETDEVLEVLTDSPRSIDLIKTKLGMEDTIIELQETATAHDQAITVLQESVNNITPKSVLANMSAGVANIELDAGVYAIECIPKDGANHTSTSATCMLHVNSFNDIVTTFWSTHFRFGTTMTADYVLLYERQPINSGESSKLRLGRFSSASGALEVDSTLFGNLHATLILTKIG